MHIIKDKIIYLWSIDITMEWFVGLEWHLHKLSVLQVLLWLKQLTSNVTRVEEHVDILMCITAYKDT